MTSVKTGPYIIYIVLFFLFTSPFAGSAQIQNNDEQLAVQYYSNREFEKSAILFANLYEKRPDAYYYIYYLQCLIELKQFDEAEKLVKKQRKKNSSSSRYTVDLGYIYELSNQPEKAKKEYERAIKEMPAIPMQISDLANAFTTRRHPELTLATYQAGRKLMESPYLFSMEIAQIHQTAGNYELMMEEYLRMIEQSPSNTEQIQLRLQGIFADDEKGTIYETIRKSILRKTQSQPDNMGFSVLMYWLSLQKNDFEMAFTQAKSIDKRFNKTEQQTFEFAKLASANQYWDVAIKAYQYIIDKGTSNEYYFSSRIELLNTKFAQLTGEYPPQMEKLTALDQQFSSLITDLDFNPEMVSFARTQAILKAYYLNQPVEAEKLLDSALRIPGVDEKEKALCKLDLGDIKLFSNNVWDATLLYSQVEKDFPNDTLGQNAKFKNAKLSFYIGEFEWAKAQLDVLRSATSKLIANDAMQLYMLIADNEDEDSTNIALKHYANADFHLYQKQYKEAILCLDSVGMLSLEHPLADEVLFKKAEIAINQGLFQYADSLLVKIVEYYSEDILADDALFLDAEINQFHLNNKEKAILQYQKIVTTYPSSVYLSEARKRFRMLRGDHIN